MAESSGIEFCRCFEIVKSLLANLIGIWNLESSTTSAQSPHLAMTLRVAEMLRQSQFLLPPLSHAVEILDRISPREVTSILMSFWQFLRDFPPSPSQYSSSDAPGTPTTTPSTPSTPTPTSSNGLSASGPAFATITLMSSSSSTPSSTATPSSSSQALLSNKSLVRTIPSCDQHPYLVPLKQVLRANITTLAQFYYRLYRS